MIPVSNSGSLASKALTGGRRTAGAGQASGFSLFYSDEETKYGDLGSPRLAEERAPIPAATAPGGAAPENRPVVRNRFHEYVEAHAVALAATQPNTPRNAAPAAADAQGATSAQKQPTWSISLVGDQIQLSLNPNAR
jgi:hypothetical protein